ncbi:MAG: ribonuclease III [Proteobacteria bacterium]|nr:ribonuclease III [Pseudomonadota bacterium]
MPPRTEEEFCALIGYRFRDPALLTEALTHSSLDGGRPKTHGPDNDRLEFLGDRVLGLVIAAHLVATFEDADAGGLARRYNSLVRRETLAKVARSLEMGDFLRMSKAEQDSGGRNKSAMLADTAEAVIAALFLDGGFEAASAFIHRHWDPLVEREGHARRDAKTALQEWAHAAGLHPPMYEEVERSGPAHDPHFVIAASLEGIAPVPGEGSSKRRAQQAAAAALLEAVTKDDAASKDAKE